MQASLSLRYFSQLMGPYGLYQHADLMGPILSEGYCADDNARAVQTLIRLLPLLPCNEKMEGERILDLCWEFIKQAETSPGTFTNFRSSDGTWLPRMPESEDMYARILRCLIEVILHDTNTKRTTEAMRMLIRLESYMQTITAPRAWAEILIALSSLKQKTEFPVYEYIHTGYQQLASLWKHQNSSDWHWFEQSMTYANALFPHALLAAKPFVKDFDEDMLQKSAHFLIRATVHNTVFVPVGSVGWYPKDGTPSKDNQQPIEASLMFDFLIAYHVAFPHRINAKIVAAPYVWFFGKNTKHAVLADTALGASYDGLFEAGINHHRGAESMLAYLWVETLLPTASREVVQYVTPWRARQGSNLRPPAPQADALSN